MLHIVLTTSFLLGNSITSIGKFLFTNNKANLTDLIAVTGLVILLKLDSDRRFFSPRDLEIWWMTPKNNRARLLYYKFCASFQTHQWIQTGVTVQKHPIWVKIDNFLAMWPWNNRATLLCYFKLCALFHSQLWFQTGVTVWKRPIWVQIDDFVSRMTLQLDVWPSKTKRHHFYAISSFVHHFVAIGEFKL